MHIPDGFIAPSVYLPALVAEVGLLYYAFRKTTVVIANESRLPLLAAMSAFCFVVMMFNIPIPGGTSGHATGIAVLSLLFGPWVAFFSMSIVLLLQALLFGDGGILTFGINALCMGFLGAFGSYYAGRLSARIVNKKISLFIAGYTGILLASVGASFALGIEPYFVDSVGKPLYFPFGLGVTIPAMVGSHALFFAPIEGVITVVAVTLAQRVYELSEIKVAR